jgi:hypothetical protein
VGWDVGGGAAGYFSVTLVVEQESILVGIARMGSPYDSATDRLVFLSKGHTHLAL